MAYKNITLDQLMQGLGQVESSGRFNALGPVTKNGDRAHGFSQVMGNNIGPWTQQYFGQRLTPEQFDNNEYAQKAVTRGKLGEYLQKFGNAPDAISAWFSGRPLRQAGNASDGFLKTPDYVNKVLNAAQGYDPNSMMAMAPEGADGQPTTPATAQSFSLGDQENQQPLNNIGSTLANMGASIASLDNRGTGIASLNASRVASNLAQQEQQRASEGGWKYAGQTANGQGLMFQNSKGEVRVEPLAPGFTGEKEPEAIRTLKMLQANPDLLATQQKMRSGTSNVDPDTGEWKYETPIKDLELLKGRMESGEQGVLARATPKLRADLNHYLAESGTDPNTFASGAVEQAGRLTDFRRFADISSRVETAVPKLQADISIARQRLEEYNKVAPKGSSLTWNKLMQMKEGEFKGPGSAELARLKEAFKTVNDQFAVVQGNGVASETSRAEAQALLNPAMEKDISGGVLDSMEGTAIRSRETLRKTLENKQARLRKKPLPYPELEADPEANGGSKRLPSIRNTGEDSGIDKNAAMEELRRRGLIK